VKGGRRERRAEGGVEKLSGKEASFEGGAGES